jgi:enoyl-CoA hydratase
VPDGTALDAAVALGDQIAAFPWTCVVKDRQSVYEGIGESLEDGLALEAQNGEPVVFADGFLDGVARFKERDRRS